jgi:ubiquitin C-terminal hydrolase
MKPSEKNTMSSSFPLHNIHGSCWINAALQGLFRCPLVQERYNKGEVDATNPIDVCLKTLWDTKGREGLAPLFDCIRTVNMPAGRGTGDSHELFQFFCDKLPWLDEACRFKVADILVCDSCSDKVTKFDSLNEINVTPSKHMTIHEAIQESCTPIDIPERTCEKCKKSGCKKQLVFGGFPKMLVFHRSTLSTHTDYSSILVLNGNKYALFAVLCWNGGHWWTYGRDLPVGGAWFRLDDELVQEITNKQFPVAGAMRMLLYFLV